VGLKIKEMGGSLESRVLEAIAQVRDFIVSDGGDIELVKIESNKVYVKLMGACKGCPLVFFTLTSGVEDAIREKAPEIESVELVD
jgi:Fe-S cluster biogenesis protein NfuA